MRVAYTGYPHLPEYSAGDVDGAWPVGSERDIPEEVAARLLADHPDAFVVVGDVGAPPVDRMVASPARKRK